MKKAVIFIVLIAIVFALATPAIAQSAADNYKAKCKMCHGEDGTAATPMGKNMNIPSFKDPTVVKMTDQQLNDIIANGKGKMPKYGDKLTKDQVGDLVKFIRGLQK
jgi:cytochrome c6